MFSNLICRKLHDKEGISFYVIQVQRYLGQFMLYYKPLFGLWSVKFDISFNISKRKILKGIKSIYRSKEKNQTTINPLFVKCIYNVTQIQLIFSGKKKFYKCMYNMDCFFLQNICEITKCTTYLCADLMRYNHLSTLRTIVILINSFQNINLTNQLTHKTSFAIKLLLYWFIIISFYSLS